jgi:hypothetical protein
MQYHCLHGSPTIPQQIQNDRTLYFRALEQADESERAGQTNVSEMEAVIRGLFATQLLSVIQEADGGTRPVEILN